MEEISMDQVINEVKRVVGEKHWEWWMNEPIPALENRIPNEVAKTNYGRWELLKVLGQMEAGTYS